jgi:hypothetical protein
MVSCKQHTRRSVRRLYDIHHSNKSRSKHTYTYIHTYIHPSHTHIHHIHTCIHAYIHTYRELRSIVTGYSTSDKSCLNASDLSTWLRKLALTRVPSTTCSTALDMDATFFSAKNVSISSAAASVLNPPHVILTSRANRLGTAVLSIP